MSNIILIGKIIRVRLALDTIGENSEENMQYNEVRLTADFLMLVFCILCTEYLKNAVKSQSFLVYSDKTYPFVFNAKEMYVKI